MANPTFKITMENGGVIEGELYPEKAPQSVANFVDLCNHNYYDGMKYGFGVDLGGTTVKIAYFDENGTMLEKWEIPTVTADGGKQILPDIAASIRAFIDAHNIADTAILGLGIGVPGPVNGKGVVNKCVNLGWGVFNISEELSIKSILLLPTPTRSRAIIMDSSCRQAPGCM